MSTEISLDSLSTIEKISLMERLWTDLSQKPEEIHAPNWHGSILAERIAAVREGRTEFREWSDAKKRLSERMK